MRPCMTLNMGIFLKDRARLEFLIEALSSISSKVSCVAFLVSVMYSFIEIEFLMHAFRSFGC